MSRRDTILIAVLINAGLLVILFSTALKSNKADVVAASTLTEHQPVLISTPSENSMPMVVANSPQDEVDQLLRQFASQVTEESTVATQAAPELNRDFVRDLNSFSQAPSAIHSPIPTVQTTPTLAQSSQAIDVVVKKGDVLEKIARVHHTSVEEIMRLNQLTSTRLKIGQVLKVAANSGKKPAAVPSEGSKFYTVKSGDNPWTIAVKNHMKVDELLRLNNLDAEKAKRLKPGDQLRIK